MTRTFCRLPLTLLVVVAMGAGARPAPAERSRTAPERSPAVGVTDPDAVLPPGPLSFQPLGVPFTDPVFGTTLRRVTDARAAGGYGTHTYSQLQAFSADNTYVLLIESGTYVVRRLVDLTPVPLDTSGWNAPRWHPTRPHTVVHYDSNDDTTLRLQYTDVDGFATTTVFTFPSAYTHIRVNESFDELSEDGRWAAGMATRVDGVSVIFSLDLVAGRLGAELSIPALYGGPCLPDPTWGLVEPDWVGVSPLGTYLVIQWPRDGTTRCSGLETLAIASGTFVGRVYDGHQHGDLGLMPDGVTEFFMTFELYHPSGQLALGVRDLPGTATSSATRYLRTMDWHGEHISCRGRRGECLVTTLGDPSDGWSALEGEVFLQGTDGSVLRLAHHRSSSCGYWVQPRASVSRDGRYVIFASDWSLAAGGDSCSSPGSLGRGEAYVVDLGPGGTTPPTISDLGDQTIPRNGTTGPLGFTVGDAETAPGLLSVSGISSDQTLVPNANLVFGGSGAGRTITVTPAASRVGVTTVTVTVTDASGLTATDSFTVTVTNAPPTNGLTYYLAEGATGAFFDLELALANPNPVAAPIWIQYFKEDGTTVQQTLTLGAQARETILVDGVTGLASTAVSTLVTSVQGLPLAVERTMTWDAGGYGSHTERATPGAASTWYFAEGSEQASFDTYLLLANPQAAANRATVVYLVENGPPVTKVHDLLPTSRTNVWAEAVEDPAGTKVLRDKAFGMMVVFDQPGVAERAMYFGTTPFWSAGHASAGVTAPSTSWFHAEGATGPFFDTFILLSNPNATPATVTLRFLLDNGATVTRARTVPANARLTVGVEGEDPQLANAAMATEVTSDIPIVSERATYWAAYPDWYEAHNAFGVTATALKWALGEGRVGGPNGHETYILLANAGATAATVTVTFLREGGLPPIVQAYAVQPTSRFNIHVNAVPGLGAGERVGALIQSTAPIAVERAMYSNASSQPGLLWAAGTSATGTPVP